MRHPPGRAHSGHCAPVSVRWAGLRSCSVGQVNLSIAEPLSGFYAGHVTRRSLLPLRVSSMLSRPWSRLPRETHPVCPPGEKLTTRPPLPRARMAAPCPSCDGRWPRCAAASAALMAGLARAAHWRRGAGGLSIHRLAVPGRLAASQLSGRPGRPSGIRDGQSALPTPDIHAPAAKTSAKRRATRIKADPPANTAQPGRVSYPARKSALAGQRPDPV